MSQSQAQAKETEIFSQPTMHSPSAYKMQFKCNASWQKLLTVQWPFSTAFYRCWQENLLQIFAAKIHLTSICQSRCETVRILCRLSLGSEFCLTHSELEELLLM